MLKIIIIVGFLMDKKHLLNLNEIFTKYFNRRINLKKNTSAKNISNNSNSCHLLLANG